MEGQGLARDWIERACLVWPFPCLGSTRLWGHIPVGVTSYIGAMQVCLLGSSWRWIQAACGLTQSWRTIHRCKCRISPLQRQLLASLSLCLCICILHWWVLCLWKPWVCYLVEVLHQDLPVRHQHVWSQAVTGWSTWGWCHWWWLAWLAEKQPHSWHSRWSRHLFSGVLTGEQSEWTGHGWRGWGMSPCQGTLGVQWHLWVLGEYVHHQPSLDLGVHHWHCIGSQRSLWLGPLHAFIFCGLNTTPYLQATCMRFCWWASCSASVWPCMVMSLAIPIHQGHSLRNWSIFFWKMSCKQTRPKGRCRKQYLPKGLLKVVKRLDSSSRTIDQYPWCASSLVK